MVLALENKNMLKWSTNQSIMLLSQAKHHVPFSNVFSQNTSVDHLQIAYLDTQSNLSISLQMLPPGSVK